MNAQSSVAITQRPGLMVVGAAGLHASKVYNPILRDETQVEVRAIVDLRVKSEELALVAATFESDPEIVLTSGWEGDQIPDDFLVVLNEVVTKRSIDAVIIATEPLSHLAYLRWAIRQRLHVLVDKPIVAYRNVSNDPVVARRILSDYLDLRQLVDAHPGQLVAVAVQRRYQAGFELARELVLDAAKTHGCPVTALSSTHADGQLRLPHELETIAYHGYKDGYGKLHHSGEHIVDFQAQLITLAADAAGVVYDGLESHVSPLRPSGFLHHIPRSTYERKFGRLEWNKVAPANTVDLRDRYAQFGEVDLIANNTFRQGSENVLLGQIKLLHNSYSQRAWLEPNPDLYKGNGRVKHERHEINQSFLQTVMIDSFQSKADHRRTDETEYNIGGNNHLVVQVFRNAAWWPRSVPRHEVFSAEELADEKGLSASALFTDHAKRAMVTDFLDCICGQKPFGDHRSPLSAHLLTSEMMAGMSESLAQGSTVELQLMTSGQRERAQA